MRRLLRQKFCLCQIRRIGGPVVGVLGYDELFRILVIIND